MSKFIQLNPDEVEQWQKYTGLQNSLLHWHLKSLVSYQTAHLNQKRLNHLESMNKFETVEDEIQHMLRYPFLVSAADNLKSHAMEKMKVEALRIQLLEIKNGLHL